MLRPQGAAGLVGAPRIQDSRKGTLDAFGSGDFPSGASDSGSDRRLSDGFYYQRRWNLPELSTNKVQEQRVSGLFNAEADTEWSLFDTQDEPGKPTMEFRMTGSAG